MKFATRLKQTASSLSSTTLSVGVVVTLGAAATNYRTLAQAISDGAAASDTTAIQVNDTNIPFVFDDGSNWMEAYCTITSNTKITIAQIISGSNGTSAVTFAGALPTVFNAIPGKWLRQVVVSTDGVAATSLTSLTLQTLQGTTVDSYLVPMIDPATGIGYTTTVAILKSLFASATPTVTSVTVSPSTVSVAGSGTQTFTASVSGANSPAQTVTWTTTAGSITSGGVFTAPAATSSAQTITITATSTVDNSKSGTSTVTIAATGSTVTGVTVSPSTASLSGGGNQTFSAIVAGANSPSQSVTWQANAGSITSGGVFTAPAATGSAQTVTITATSVQDNTKSGTATVTVAAASQTIVVTNPGTQTVNTPYTLSGTWTGTQPAALDYQTTDNGGTPSSWTAAASPTINANGTWSFSVTPTTASSSRTISVRDHTTSVSGTSTAYVVNAAATMASMYLLTNTNSATASFTAATMSGTSPNMNASTTVRVNIRSALTNSATYPNNADVKFVWGKLGNACPAVFSDTVVHAGGNGNNTDTNTTGVGVASHLGGWADSSSGFFGTFTPSNSFNAWGTPGTYVLWVMFSDGSSKMYDNNQGQGNPLTWVLS